MAINNILNYYEEIKDDLTFQNTSSIRTKIMISLSEGPQKTDDLQELTGIQLPIILQGIHELEKQNLILNDGDHYSLSKIGAETTSKLVDMIKTLIVLKNNRELWLNHEIDAIPHDLLMEIEDLSKSQLIESEPEDLLKTHKKHAQIVLNSKEVKGVSPIFYSDYLETFASILNKGTTVELVLTENILKKTVESLDPEGLDEFKRLISENKLKIYEIKKDVKVAFTVTDKSIALGLFSMNGKYDPTTLLVSDHSDALIWGNKLFDYYVKKSQKISLEYFEEI